MVAMAGLFETTITPDKPIYLAGFPNRFLPSEGVDDPLFLRILALQDERGSRAAIVTADLLKLPKDLAWRLKHWAAKTLNVDSAALVLNVSHSHCTPALFWQECYPQWPLDVAYIRQLELTIRHGLTAAFGEMRPTTIRYGLHHSDLGVSRRQPHPDYPGKVRLGAYPDGYHDPEMPLLSIADAADGRLRAVLYSYGCHPTSRHINRVSADWPGVISRGMKRRLGEDVVTLFAQGAGASVMPRCGFRPEDPEPYAAFYDAEAERMSAFLCSDDMRDVNLRLAAREHEFQLPYDMARMPDLETLRHYADPAEPPVDRYIGPANRQILRLWADGLLERLRQGTQARGFGMLVTRLTLDPHLQMLTLSGEITAQVGRLLKDAEQIDTIMLGYCNYTDAYIPTAALLPEEGHEVYQSLYFHSRPAPFTADIDQILLQETARTRIEA